ncbi:MAG TPA: hypothetical protein VK887_10275 [Pseudonocardiaceae bacterium]|nr:hypothetical protein [Pseudonocardiaceae bacterium]
MCDAAVAVQVERFEQKLVDPSPELWYADCGIKYVNVLDMIASSTQARVARTPETVPTPSVAVGFDGVFPRSGVAFVWALEDELALRRR